MKRRYEDERRLYIARLTTRPSSVARRNLRLINLRKWRVTVIVIMTKMLHDSVRYLAEFCNIWYFPSRG